MASGLNHHRNAQDNFNEYLLGRMTLTSTPAEIKVGATILKGRTKLFIINDSSNIVFVSDDPGFTPGLGEPEFFSFSGEVITISLDPNPPDGVQKTFFAALTEGTTSIRILEAK